MNQNNKIRRDSSIQKIKNYLVKLGPDHFLTQLLLWCYGLLRGYSIQFSKHNIEIRKNKKCFVVNKKNYFLVPLILQEWFEERFNTIDAQQINGEEVLDFSKPGLHRSKRYQVEFVFPAIAEESAIDVYTNQFKPSLGMTVFDFGAHIGSVTYFFSKMVGEKGKVYSFEPDETNLSFLKENIKNHNLKNVTIVNIALGSQAGKKAFYMDGSMSSSLVENAFYLPKDALKKEVDVLTLEECCEQFKVIPDFIKMDIEGAEVEVISKSLEFIKKHSIHFAIESNHILPDGNATYHQLENLFKSIGYSVISSNEFGEMFTWASPQTDH